MTKFYKWPHIRHLLFIIFQIEQSKFPFENFLKILFRVNCTEKWRHQEIAEKGPKTFPIDCAFFLVVLGLLRDLCAKFQPHTIFFKVKAFFELILPDYYKSHEEWLTVYWMIKGAIIKRLWGFHSAVNLWRKLFDIIRFKILNATMTTRNLQ